MLTLIESSKGDAKLSPNNNVPRPSLSGSVSPLKGYDGKTVRGLSKALCWLLLQYAAVSCRGGREGEWERKGQPVSKIVKEYVKRWGGGGGQAGGQREVELEVRGGEERRATGGDVVAKAVYCIAL